MSYTKFSKAVTKWLKANGLPCYGTAYDTVIFVVTAHSMSYENLQSLFLN